MLLDVSGEQDVDLARQIARTGHGTLARIRTYRDVAPAPQPRLRRLTGRRQ